MVALPAAALVDPDPLLPELHALSTATVATAVAMAATFMTERLRLSAPLMFSACVMFFDMLSSYSLFVRGATNDGGSGIAEVSELTEHMAQFRTGLRGSTDERSRATRRKVLAQQRERFIGPAPLNGAHQDLAPGAFAKLGRARSLCKRLRYTLANECLRAFSDSHNPH
ncbi:hypothetical protein GCM10027568_33060 [Humibacter soli]